MASREYIIARLKGVHLFSGLDRHQLRILANIVKESQVFQPGTAVCRQGEPGDRYFVVDQGALRVVRVDTEGRTLEEGILGPGDSFGETSLFLGDVRDATVETTATTTLLTIERTQFNLLIEQRPDVERALRLRSDVAERKRHPNFPWLEEGELPVKVLHKHPAVLLPSLLIPGLMFLTVILAGLLAQRLWGGVSLTIGLILLVIPFGLGLYVFYDWRNDVYVVTNRRVIHRERIGLVREHFSAAPLQAIQDVQQVQIGLIARVSRFGDLVLETGGGAGQVVFRSIPDPNKIRNVIFEQKARAQALVRAGEQAAIRKLMQDHFLNTDTQQPSEQPTEVSEKPARPGYSQSFAALLRAFLPPSWHQEGATITWRKHWIALFRTVGIPIFVFALTTVVVAVIAVRLPNALPPATVLYALAAFFLAPWFMWQLDDWQNDFYQVSATRIIHVERLPFFLREERREAHLEEVTNVRFEQSFWGKLLRYGDVIIETAAPAGVFQFKMVTHPRGVQAEIFAHIEAARRFRQERQAQQHQAELLDWFSIYEDIREKLSRTQHSAGDQEESDE